MSNNILGTGIERSFPFNSVGGDRRYKAEHWAEYFADFIGNGIYPRPSNGLQLIANNDMTITIKAGTAFINGTRYRLDRDATVELDVADGVLNRIDRFVVRWDLFARMNYITINKSNIASTPIPAGEQRTPDIFELVLGDVFVGRGAVAINQGNITDHRFNANLCGIVTGVVNQIDPSTLTAQFDGFFNQYRNEILTIYGSYNRSIDTLLINARADHKEFVDTLEELRGNFGNDFMEWFNNLQVILAGDVAANIATQLLNINEKLDNLESIQFVVAAENTATIKVVGDNFQDAKIAANNQAVFRIPRYGNYELTATMGDEFAATNVIVDNVKIYHIPLFFLDIQLVITTDPHALVTITDGATIIQDTAPSSGELTFRVFKFGTWTIKASLGDEETTITIVVDKEDIYNVFLMTMGGAWLGAAYLGAAYLTKNN